MRYILLVLTVGLAACGMQSSSSGSSGAQGLRVADAALNAGTPGVAVQVTEGLLATDPRNVEALLRQGRAHVMLGNAAAAETAFRRALAINDRLDEARLGLGRIWLKTRPAQAEKIFGEVLEHGSGNAQALNNIGVARDLQGRHGEAQEAYRQALALVPALASARENLGLSLAVSGKAQEGVEMLDRLAQDGPPTRRSRDNLAVALTLTGRTGEAGRVLQEELSQDDASKAVAGYRALSGLPAR